MPRCLGTSQSVRARSRPRSAWWALVLHSFCPLTTHSSPSRSARVVRPARSEPLPGSLNSWHHVSSPVIARGSSRRFSSSDAVGEQRRRGEAHADADRRADGAGRGELLGDDGVGPAGQAAAEPLDRPRRRRPAGWRGAAAPVDERQRRGPSARRATRAARHGRRPGVVTHRRSRNDAQRRVERRRVADGRGVAGAVDDGRATPVGSSPPCTASRRGTARRARRRSTSVGAVMRRQRLDDVAVGLPQHAARGAGASPRRCGARRRSARRCPAARRARARRGRWRSARPSRSTRRGRGRCGSRARCRRARAAATRSGWAIASSSDR